LNAISFQNVFKTLSGKVILNDISFDIKKGDVFVIVGPSGTGKSVTLKHMVRLMTPDKGNIMVGDDNVSTAVGAELTEIRRKFGFLFQGGALLAWMTVAENVALPLREHTKLTENEIQEKVHNALALVGLENDKDKTPAKISGGMSKRAGLARAIIEKPEIILYDEPTSGLDPVTARHIDALITKTRDELKGTSIVVTHDLHSALSIGTKIAMLYNGNIVEISTPEEFIKSSNKEVQEFLASQYITRRGAWERKQ
jgi:phospholipid/cholesterol/gamma-HCH transport system ATP-binding protein